MKSKILLSTLMVLAFSLAACAPATETPTAVVDTPVEMATDTPAVAMDTPTTEAMPTDTAAAVTDTPASADTPTAGGNAPLSVSQAAGMSAFLVDANGMAVYVFAKDTQNATTSACTGTCATTWLPVTMSGAAMPASGTTMADTATPVAGAMATDTPAAGAMATDTPAAGTTMDTTPTTDASMSGTPGADQIDMTKIGSITLPDGTEQLTYNGWPLYHYAQDMAPGDTKGEGMQNNWYLVSPSGDMIKE
jgi:predicted lipoprotein with Yx(FWY)xxD motif